MKEQTQPVATRGNITKDAKKLMYNRELSLLYQRWNQTNTTNRTMPDSVKKKLEAQARKNVEAAFSNITTFKTNPRKLPKLNPSLNNFKLPEPDAKDNSLSSFKLPEPDTKDNSLSNFKLPEPDAAPAKSGSKLFADLCNSTEAVEFNELCPNGNCPGYWSWSVFEDGATVQYQGKSFSQFKKSFIKSFNTEDGAYNVSVSLTQPGDPHQYFEFYAGASDSAEEALKTGQFICNKTESGTAGGTQGTDFTDPVDDSESNVQVRRRGTYNAESGIRARFYKLATQVTGESDKKEAVRIIQRALVDMGFRVDKKNEFGATNAMFPKTSSEFNPNIKGFIKRFGPWSDDSNYDNLEAVWPRDDEKYLVDGIPGEKTRNAVMRLQYLAKGTTDLGNTGPYGDGVDGVVGPLTWPLFEFNYKQNTIKSLKSQQSSDESSSEVGQGLAPRYDAAAVAAVTAQQRRGVVPPTNPEERETIAAQQVEVDAKLDFNLLFTGVRSFDKKIKISFQKGKLLNMASQTRNIGLRTQTGQISPEFDTLMYDAYFIYENLDGLGSGDEDEIKEIIIKYCHDVDLYVSLASTDSDGDAETEKFDSLNETGWGLFGNDDKYFFKAHALYYAYNGRLVLEDDTDSGDLIKWLADDGLEKEAKIVKTRLAAESHIARTLYSMMRKGKQVEFEILEGILRRAGDLQRLENQGGSGSSLGNNEKRPGLKGMGNPTRRSQTVTGDPEELEPLNQRTNFIRDRGTRRFRPAGPGEGP